MATPTNSMSRLEAVNEILAASSMAPVSSLAAGGPVTSALAEQELDRQTRQVQAMGWWFNTQYEVVLSRNADDEVVIPANIIRVDSRFDDVAVIQGKLYSKTGQSFIWTSDPEVYVTYLYDFEDIPYEAQKYITTKAAVRFQMSQVGDNTVHRQLSLDERDARLDLMQAEGENGDHNILLNYNLYQHIRPRPGNSGINPRFP